MTKLCVFDCDGTLVDSLRPIVESMTRAFTDEGRAPPAPDAVRHVVGLPLAAAVAGLAPDAAEAEVARLVAGYSDAFGELRRRDAVEEPLFPGIDAVLDAIEAAGWRLAVATGKSRRGLINTLTRHGLADRFVSLQTSDTGPGKPAPDMVLRAMSEAGATPEATVVVGDTTFDMLMARGAGALAVGVAWGYHPPEDLTDAGAHVIVRETQALPGEIGRLLGTS